MNHILLCVGQNVYSACGLSGPRVSGYVLPDSGLLEATHIDCLDCLGEYHHLGREVEHETCLACTCCHRFFPVSQLSNGLPGLCDECNRQWQARSRERDAAWRQPVMPSMSPVWFDMLTERAFPSETEV